MTIVGLHDFVKVSTSAEFKSFFADHMHWRAGIDNKFSFLWFNSLCRQAPVFRRWEECCSLMLLSFFNTLLASLHAASRAHRSFHSVSSWDRSSNFGALGWGSPGHMSSSDAFWSRMSAWRNKVVVNRTHRIGLSMFELFRKIDEDFGGSMLCHTQPNNRVCTLSPFFSNLLLAVRQPDDVHMWDV